MAPAEGRNFDTKTTKGAKKGEDRQDAKVAKGGRLSGGAFVVFVVLVVLVSSLALRASFHRYRPISRSRAALSWAASPAVPPLSGCTARIRRV